MQEKVAVVVGGGGFLGARLAEHLVGDHGFARVLSLDVSFPNQDRGNRLRRPEVGRLRCDLACPSSRQVLERAFQGAHCVFLVASYGMSGAEQLDVERVRQVNLHGTQRVLDACLAVGAPRLVYTSTYNVVFNGQVIRGGDESLPYCTRFVDEYSRTKTLAEMMVLQANCDRLMTAACRPAAIWGFGERRHMARVKELIDSGLFVFSFGNDDAKVDFVHVNNLAAAHALLASKLEPGSPVAGRAYFISDNRPQNNFDFFLQLKVQGKGLPSPRLIHVPLMVVYVFALCCEFFHRSLGVAWRAWMLTRAEVYKAGVEHFMSIESARRDIGYEPKEYSFGEVIDQWCAPPDRNMGKNKGKNE